MIKMDFTKSYGHTFGSSIGAVYEQDGRPFNAAGILIEPAEVVSTEIELPANTIIIPTDAVENAKSFLRQILKGGPIAKNVVFKEAEANNQQWQNVTDASVDMNLAKFNFKKGDTTLEMWKLTEES